MGERKGKQGYERLVRDPASKHMANDGPARVVWVAEVQPVCETDRPSLVVDLIDERPILVRDPERGDARHAFGIRGM